MGLKRAHAGWKKLMGDVATVLDAKQKENDFCRYLIEVIITNITYVSHPLPHGVINVDNEI